MQIYAYYDNDEETIAIGSKFGIIEQANILYDNHREEFKGHPTLDNLKEVSDFETAIDVLFEFGIEVIELKNFKERIDNNELINIPK